VQVLDFGIDPVVGPYIVMELLEGESLEARILREQKLSPTVTVSLLLPVLDALTSVHARSIVHRDLKPANLFVSRNEEGEESVKILDFGVARVRDGRRATTTAAGLVVGTPRYMAPEQALGVADLDARADLYAIGAIAYTCLAGRPPYAELSHADVISAILSGPPTPLAQLVADIPPALLAVIEKAMARDRDQRFSTAAEMRAALLMAMGSNSMCSSEPNGTGVERPSSTIDGPLTKSNIALTRPGDASMPVSVIPVTKCWQLEQPKLPIVAEPAVPSAVLPPPGLAPAAIATPAPSSSALVGPFEPMPLAPASQPAPLAMSGTTTESPARRSHRRWLVALVLMITLFVGLASFAVWYFVDDVEEWTLVTVAIAPRVSATG
jgi:serine/threonine-protein kinase